MISYEDFLKEFSKFGKIPDKPITNKKSKEYNRYDLELKLNSYDDKIQWTETNECWEDQSVNLVLVHSWIIGKTRSSSSWEHNDASTNTYETGELEPNWDLLDNILEQYWPEISFLKYKKLMKLVKVKTQTEHEYYGNSTDYGVKLLKVEDLYNFLNENFRLP